MQKIRVLDLGEHSTADVGMYGSFVMKIDTARFPQNMEVLVPYSLLEELATKALASRILAFLERQDVTGNELPLNPVFFETDKLLSADTTPEGHDLTFSTNAGDTVALRIPKGELTTIIERLHKLHGRDHVPTVLQ